ncbi:MAG TPA: class I SAM-dependent methyltransferase [Terrimicrobiaceae bacterium]
MPIHYDHNRNEHSITGAEAALPQIFCDWRPKSILDVGCGTGTWMKAALNIGITDVFGIDGVELRENDLLVESSLRAIIDLTTAWSLERRFDAVLCLEVAEHLNDANAPTLVDALVAHSDYVIFSAACPRQRGQHHVNCQWPAYWQALFNKREYACSDDVRWRIWDDDRIEPWYRQNMFVATRDKSMAGLDPQIKPVVHPGVWSGTMPAVEHGCLEWHWYLSCPPLALLRKAMRRLKKGLSKA